MPAALAAAAVTVLFWASAFVSIRSAGDAYSPGALALGRLLTAAVLLGAFALVRRVGWPHVITGSDRRFIGYDTSGTGPSTRVAVFDATTGRTLSQHVGWDLVSQRFAEWTPIVQRGRGLSWNLATLNTESGTAYPLGTFDAAGERSCQSTRTHVACSVRSGEIKVWNHVPTR